MFHPAAQQVRAHAELHDPPHGSAQPACGIALQVGELLADERCEAADTAGSSGPGGSGGFAPEPTPRQDSSSTSKSQVTSAPVPPGKAGPRASTSISKADST